MVQVEEGDVRLTDHGRQFVAADTDTRKRLFRDHLLQFVPLIGLIRRVLDERPTHIAPASRFREELEDHMSEADATETLRAAVSWGRYAEVFAYDERAQHFTLENPV
jgi:NitT/TauT family transport system ATP-binding protein